MNQLNVTKKTAKSGTPKGLTEQHKIHILTLQVHNTDCPPQIRNRSQASQVFQKHNRGHHETVSANHLMPSSKLYFFFITIIIIIKNVKKEQDK